MDSIVVVGSIVRVGTVFGGPGLGVGFDFETMSGVLGIVQNSTHVRSQTGGQNRATNHVNQAGDDTANHRANNRHPAVGPVRAALVLDWQDSV